MLEQFAMESIFKTELWHNVVSPVCLNFYLYLETPNYMDRALPQHAKISIQLKRSSGPWKDGQSLRE